MRLMGVGRRGASSLRGGKNILQSFGGVHYLAELKGSGWIRVGRVFLGGRAKEVFRWEGEGWGPLNSHCRCAPTRQSPGVPGWMDKWQAAW